MTSAGRPDLPARLVDADGHCASRARHRGDGEAKQFRVYLGRLPRDGVDGHCGRRARRPHALDVSTRSRASRARHLRALDADGYRGDLSRRPHGASRHGEVPSSPQTKDLCAWQADPRAASRFASRATCFSACGRRLSRQNSAGGQLLLVAREARDGED